jgi:hypothetical protein
VTAAGILEHRFGEHSRRLCRLGTMWLDPPRAALDGAPRPVEFFFRDDDAGWDDERLFAMLEVIERHSLLLALAVIPQALTPSLARSLIERSGGWGGSARAHEHGLAHRATSPKGVRASSAPRGSARRRAGTTPRTSLQSELVLSA